MDRRGAWLLPGFLVGVMAGIATADAGRLGTAMFAVVVGSVVGGVVLRVMARPMLGSAVLAAAALVLGMVLGGLRGLATTPPGGPGSVDTLATGTTWRVSGTIADEPVPRGDAIDVVLDDLRLADDPIGGRLLVRVPRSASVMAGDQVALEVSLRPPDPSDVEGTAYRERLRRQGIGAVGRAFEVTVIGHRSDPLTDSFGTVRRWLLDGLVTTVPEPEASLGAGILLGVRAGIDPAVRDAFAVAGLSHVVAISGWNVAIVVVLIGALTRRLRRRAGPALPAMVAVVAVAGYVVLVGASPAVVRAALMAGALLVSRLGGSPAHAGSALMAAVVAMLVISPPALWDVGFQLSALATGGLIVLGGALEQRLARWPVWIRTPVALTVAAQLATLPVLLATFEQVSLVAPVANVVVVPLVPAVMAGSALAAVVGGLAAALPLPGVSDTAGWFGGGAAWLPLRALITAGTTAAELPLAALPVTGGPWFTVAWYPLLAVVARRLSRQSDPGPATAAPLEVAGRLGLPQVALPEAAAFATALTWVARPRRAVAGLVLVLAGATLLTGPDGRLHLTALDIGQGDAILIEAPDGSTALIDAGVDPDLTLRRIGQALAFHERQIEVVILTHPHQDHLGGLGEVLRRYEVSLFVDGGRPLHSDPHHDVLAAAQHEPGARVMAASAGQVIPLGRGAQLEILFPTADDVARALPDGDINNASIVALLRYGGFSALLTGDAEAPVEALLAARGLLRQVDVLKVGHHGSDSGTTDAFLSLVQPSVAMISAGIDNQYSHPNRSTLENLEEVPGLTVYRTDLDGGVEVVTDGRAYWVVSGRGQTAPTPARDGETVRTGRIEPWPCPTAPLPARCSPPITHPIGWSSIPRALLGWQPRRRGCLPTTGCRSTHSWSRRLPGCTTSTRGTRVPTAATDWQGPSASPPWAMGSWPTRSPPIRSPACSIPNDPRAAGRPSVSRSQTAGLANLS
ncbi:MAG TPA: DNA internalization-related competence protein ComEC/Rec2 [Pleomorphomonadaceae bacterium]|nr:DNA internalization-related competence protein ComEC/Rec2 [Pleomorphomonadaceae bacterium]